MGSILDGVAKVNSFINDIVWGWPVIILILGTGLLLSIRTGFLQLRKFGDSLSATIVPTVKSLKKKEGWKSGKGGGVTPFEAFSAAISGTVGTGNIVGVASAILTGGPGAVFWMWISAFFGMVTNYAENVLGMYFRKRNEDGSFSGGAMYYIEHGLGWKWLGYVAAVFCLLAAIGMSGVQTNKIATTVTGALDQAFTFTNETTVKLVIGVVVAALAGLIILGGIQRIGKVASRLVPFMSVLFLVMALCTVLINVKNVPEAIGSIFGNAFNFKAAGGGIFGYTFATIIRKGMARGVFSNEAGLGSSVIAHCASETREPVKQGLWGVFEVFFDTFVICTVTALMILVTADLHSVDLVNMADTELSAAAFTHNFGAFGTVGFTVILPLFAFTTIMAWSYYGEKAAEYCFGWLGKKGQKIAVVVFKVLYVLLIVVASVNSSELAWALSDTANGLMAIPNLVAVVGLSGLVVKITNNYYDRKKGLDVEPMLSAFPKQNEEFQKDLAN